MHVGRRFISRRVPAGALPRAAGRAHASAATSAAERLTRESAGQLLRSVDAFLFDCDGVIWRGDSVLDGVPETLAALRGLGKRLAFVTNNSTKSRAGYLKKFTGLGLDVEVPHHLNRILETTLPPHV